VSPFTYIPKLERLSALLINVGNLTGMSSEDGAFRQGLHKVKTLAENCVNQVRNMALLLRPSMLDDLGLVAALDWQAREVSKRTGMLVDTLDENVSENLPEEYKTCVYRIVQEALNNCSKHAYAKNERVGQMGGVLKVESDPVRGPRLRVDLLLPNASADSGELRGFVN
jgi:signal transduction histidine kinase